MPSLISYCIQLRVCNMYTSVLPIICPVPCKRVRRYLGGLGTDASGSSDIVYGKRSSSLHVAIYIGKSIDIIIQLA